MSQLPASFKPRRLAPAFALVCALLLSYLSIRNALAAHYAGLGTLQGYQRATRLEAGNFENWHLLGRYWQYNLEDPDPTRAIRAYRVALSLNPRSAEIWGDLGAAQEAAGNITAARDAFLHAKKAYPLSADVSWSYGNFLLRQGESDAAFLEMRRAVEAEPRRGAEALSRALRANPSIEGVVDRVLGSPPDAGQLGEGSAVYVDPRGRIYAADERTGAVHVFDPAGRPLRVCRPDHRAADAIGDELAHAADVGRHDWKRARHRFEDGVRRIVEVGRQREHVRGRLEVAIYVRRLVGE